MVVFFSSLTSDAFLACYQLHAANRDPCFEFKCSLFAFNIFCSISSDIVLQTIMLVLTSSAEVCPSSHVLKDTYDRNR